MIEWQTLFVGLIAPIFVGFVSACLGSAVTTYFGFFRYKKEKLWERKASAYSDVIAALYDARLFSLEHFGALEEGREISDERDKELRALAKASDEKIQKARDTGIFYLSEDAVNRLHRYESDSSKAKQTTHWAEYLEGDLAALSSCLKDIIQIARKDLRF